MVYKRVSLLSEYPASLLYCFFINSRKIGFENFLVLSGDRALFGGKHFFKKFLASPRLCKDNRNILVRFKPGKENHLAGQVQNFYRSSHIQNKYFSASAHSSCLHN